MRGRNRRGKEKRKGDSALFMSTSRIDWLERGSLHAHYTSSSMVRCSPWPEQCTIRTPDFRRESIRPSSEWQRPAYGARTRGQRSQRRLEFLLCARIWPPQVLLLGGHHARLVSHLRLRHPYTPFISRLSSDFHSMVSKSASMLLTLDFVLDMQWARCCL